MTEHTIAIYEYAQEHGYDATAEHFKVSKESVKRRCREVKQFNRETGIQKDKEFLENNENATESREYITRERYANLIADKYSLKELQSISRGHRPNSHVITPVHDFQSGDWVKIGVITDTHLGSIYSEPSLIYDAFEMFDQSDVDMVVHAGDVTEGMSNRAGHVYELSHIGYTAQKKHAIEVLSQWKKTPFYMIDGNHDRWFIKNTGAYIVEAICEAIPNAEYLGSDEGAIWLDQNQEIECRLWHGEDGNSYAISYRLQKLVESFSGGTKPNVLIAGHVHKQGNFMIRNVQCFSAGCMQTQSKWMRSKKIAAHTGFWILNLKIYNGGVSRVVSEWFPFYL